MLRDFYCISCKHAEGFPMMGSCADCAGYSRFEMAENVSEKKFKKDCRKFELFVFFSVLFFFFLALFLSGLKIYRYFLI